VVLFIGGYLNFGGLKDKVTSENLDVLNGIAYHKVEVSFFVTGKKLGYLIWSFYLKKP